MKLADRLVEICATPVPLRTLAVRKLLKRWPIGSYRTRLKASAVERPHYGWCLYNAAEEARGLGYKAITVVEMGVAGGNGIVCLCRQRKEILRELGVEIVLAGFDSGSGLPPSQDSRDLLYLWPANSFEMDRKALEKRIGGQAELIIGDVAQTVGPWNPSADAPLGAVLFDLDLYSSTAAALGLLTKANVLPRIWCYFDDISGYPEHAYSDNIGEREAIRQFNLAPERRVFNDHLSPAYSFRGLPIESWHNDIYVYHRLKHPQYNICLSKAKHQLTLDH